MQQPSSPTGLSTVHYVLAGLATILSAAIGALVTFLLKRPKVAPEVDLLQAQAGKTRAEMRSLDGKTLDRAYDRIDELQEIVEALRTEMLRLRPIEQENLILTEWNRRMRAALIAKGLQVPDKWVSGEHSKPPTG